MSLPHTQWLTWACLSFLVHVTGITRMRYSHLAITEIHLSQCLVLVGAQHTLTISNGTITGIIVSLSASFYIYFLSLTWQLGKGLVL